MTPGRNDPCPCGSGRKYKHCHLAVDQTTNAAARDDTASPLHDMDNRLTEQMAAFASSRRLGGSDLSAEFPSLVGAEDGLQFLIPWSVYIAPIDGRPVVDWFLESRSWSLTPGEIEWLQAQRRSWLSIWEVLEVRRGRGMRLADRLTFEERFVHEVSGSMSARPHLFTLCRVIDAGKVSVIAGAHPQPLLPTDATALLQHIRTMLRKKGALSPDLLRRPETASLLAHAWDDAVQQIRQRPAPELRNTDGDPLLLTAESYRFDPPRRAEVEKALASIPNMQRDDPDSFSLLRDRTIVGTVLVRDGKLRIETISARRAETLGTLVQDACGSLLGHRVRSHSDPQAAIGRKAKPRPPSTAEEAEVIRDFKRKHYEQWLKSPIPALDDKTPHQAARGKRGREKLATLIDEMELSESRLPENERFDFGILRTALGLNR